MTVRRKGPRRRGAEIQWADLDWIDQRMMRNTLQHGTNTYDLLPIRDETGLRAFWDELGDDITEGRIAMLPGTRPWGWWKFNQGIDPPADQLQYLSDHRLLIDGELERIEAEYV